MTKPKQDWFLRELKRRMNRRKNTLLLITGQRGSGVTSMALKIGEELHDRRWIMIDMISPGLATIYGWRKGPPSRLVALGKIQASKPNQSDLLEKATKE